MTRVQDVAKLQGRTVCTSSFINMSTLQSFNSFQIICCIHQPRYSIYKLFDQVMILSKGEAAYNGHALEVIEIYDVKHECFYGFKAKVPSHITLS